MRTHAVGSSQEVEDIVARGRRAVEWSRYYEEARELAYMLTEWSLGLDTTHHRFVVTSGGGPGIMEAANRGATEAGGKTIGLNISLPHEQGPNPYITDDLHFEFHYFFMRKFWFAYLAKALVVFPGGFGTLDEMFEILTLMQTEKLAKQIQILLYGSEYWDQVLNMKPLVEWGAIAERDSRSADARRYAGVGVRAIERAPHAVPPQSARRAGEEGAGTRENTGVTNVEADVTGPPRLA
jgi:uncharacterized protein (TIGR00730 family)